MEGASGGFDQLAGAERLDQASGLRLRKGAAPEGGHLDAAPAQAWPGRIMIAKPYRSYLPAVNEISTAG
jgi:hypothetical protein